MNMALLFQIRGKLGEITAEVLTASDAAGNKEVFSEGQYLSITLGIIGKELRECDELLGQLVENEKVDG